MRARARRRALRAGSCDRNGLAGRLPAGAGGRAAGVPELPPAGEEGFGATGAAADCLAGAAGAAGALGGAAIGAAEAGFAAGGAGAAAAGRAAGAAGRCGAAAGRGGAPAGAGAGGVIDGRDTGGGSGAGLGSDRTTSGRLGSLRTGSGRGDSARGASRGGWTAGGCDGAAVAAVTVGAAGCRPASASRRTANTALHTAHRARTPASGTLAGSTR